MDEGWTRWVLDRYQFDYTKLHNDDIKPGNLRQRFDAIILPDQRTNSILDGLDFKTIVEQYRGGLGDAGLGRAAPVRRRGRHLDLARRSLEPAGGQDARSA